MEMKMLMVDDEEEEETLELPECPWCGRNETIAEIQKCSGYKPSGMPPNQTGHPYGCGCQDCRAEYQSLK